MHEPPKQLPRLEGSDIPDPLEGRRLLLRLIVAFVCVAAMTTITLVVLPHFGVYLPPWIPLAAFGIIAIAVLANAFEEGQFAHGPVDGAEDVIDYPTSNRSQHASSCCSGGNCGCGSSPAHEPQGRAVGCCPGPRPPRFLRQSTAKPGKSDRLDKDQPQS